MDNTLILDDSIAIWRFLRLNAFIELIAGNFVQVRADAFDDPMEGAFGFKDTQISRFLLSEIHLDLPASTTWKNEILSGLKSRALITSWFEFDRESYAMWRVYGRIGESVAIVTTVGQLRRVLADQPVRIERIRYNPLCGEITDLREPFFHKTPEYAYEREIRSVQIQKRPVGSKIYNKGLTLSELDEFINKVVVAPGNRAILPQAVQTIVTGVFNIAGMRFSGSIEPSQLDQYLIS